MREAQFWQDMQIIHNAIAIEFYKCARDYYWHKHLLEQREFNPDQPRDELGKWTSGEATIENVGGFKGIDTTMKIDEFISCYCLAKIRREIPGEFLGMSLDDLFKLKGATANKCYKLLNEDRFRK